MTAAYLYDLARMTVATAPGVGAITLGAAVPSFLTFAQAGVLNGQIVRYSIRDGLQREVGFGTYTSAGPGLTRNVRKSTNGDALLNLTAGAVVAIVETSEDILSFVRDQTALFTSAERLVARTNLGAAGSDETAGAAGDILLNGNGQINQAGTTTPTDAAYGHDQWYALTQTAAITVSTGVDHVPVAVSGQTFLRRIMGLQQHQGAAQRYGYCQVIEGQRCKGYRGQLVTLSAILFSTDARNIRYAIVEHTGGEDSVARDIVNNWTSTGYTAADFFIAGLTIRHVGVVACGAGGWASINQQVTLGAAFNNLYVFFWTEATAPASQATLLVANLRSGANALPVVFRSEPDELVLCRRYFFWQNSWNSVCTYSNGTTNCYICPSGILPNRMRINSAPWNYNVGGTTTLFRRDGGATYTFTSINAANQDGQAFTNIVVNGPSAPLTWNDQHVMTNMALNARL